MAGVHRDHYGVQITFAREKFNASESTALYRRQRDGLYGRQRQEVSQRSLVLLFGA